MPLASAMRGMFDELDAARSAQWFDSGRVVSDIGRFLAKCSTAGVGFRTPVTHRDPHPSAGWPSPQRVRAFGDGGAVRRPRRCCASAAGDPWSKRARRKCREIGAMQSNGAVLRLSIAPDFASLVRGDPTTDLRYDAAGADPARTSQRRRRAAAFRTLGLKRAKS